ncbi:MAG TPA: amidohydrolase/deacetylase family metallohydrolase [Edaphobacter sp.]|nr:amidohydrolase/deacetylase family metallohydrolase [Edaphobacter sp.]
MEQQSNMRNTSSSFAGAPQYDLLLQGGHVIDPRNRIDGIMDIAIKDGRIAKVADHVPSSEALKTIQVNGLYVTPGLLDIHVHVYAGTGEAGSFAGDYSVPPDGFTFRNGVTTVADAGCAGWRNFEDFKQRVIDRSLTRVLAFLNIVGHGMRGDRYEQDTSDMDNEAAAKMARKYPESIVGIKIAHFAGPEWTSVERATAAGREVDIPVMVDFGVDHATRPLYDLMTQKLRPGDIYTHMYSGLRHEQDPETLGPSKAFLEGRERGIYFDLGTGGGSFNWSLAIPMVRDGFSPDSFSTDLHIRSMNSATKDLLNVTSKMLAIGIPLTEAIASITSRPAHEIKRDDLGNLSEGSVADIAVLRLVRGDFGFTDMKNLRVEGHEKLIAELTVKDGKIVYDLNGIESRPWTSSPQPPEAHQSRWTMFAPQEPDMHGLTPKIESH